MSTQTAARLPDEPLSALPPRIARYLSTERPQTPCVVVDLDIVETLYRDLHAALPFAALYYAMKANPAPPVMRRLHGLGARVDVASAAEIEQCLRLGIAPADLSYGNTIKKERDIAWAARQGIDLFALDCRAELQKIARAAPGARVFVRLFADNANAEWPLSRKFGCSPAMARDLLVEAHRLGLVPYGLSFHVGSQQTDLSQWDRAFADAAFVFDSLSRIGLRPGMLNIGGGFPSRYRADVPDIDAYGATIEDCLTRHFGARADWPVIAAEPGRYLTGDAGVLASEVVLIAEKDIGGPARWVYLDIGRFGGLAETEGEAIKYRLVTARDGGENGSVALAGPTCDSADVLYEKAGYTLPLDLQIGDRVYFLAAGAYTTSYASQGFNGILPPAEHYI